MTLKVMVIGVGPERDVYTREFVRAVVDKGLSVAPFYMKKNSDVFLSFMKLLMELRKSNVIHFQFYVSVFDVLVSPLILLLYTLARLMNKKTATTLHSIILPSNKSVNSQNLDFLHNVRRGVRSKFYVRNLVRLSDLVIVHTQTAKTLLEKVYTVSNVVFFPIASYKSSETTSHSLKTPKQKFGISEEDRVLMIFGRPAPHKGFHFVIQALPEIIKEVGHVKVLIAGGLPVSHNKEGKHTKGYLDQLKELSMKHCVEDHVILIGYVSEPEISSLLSIADIVIFAYDRRTLAMSGALCHTVSALKPIICTDIPAFEFLEDGKTCIKITGEDVKSGIVSGAALLLSSSTLCAELSRNLNELRVNLSIGNFATKYVQLISE